MNNNLDKIFEKFEDQFNIEEPKTGHFDRFEAKLNVTRSSRRSNYFKLVPYMAIAASIVLFFGIWIGTSISQPGLELAEVSSEMQETQHFFINTIEKELATIEKERNTDNEQLIKDALNQLNKLEGHYKALTLELKNNSEDKRLIYAMISNFQQRIEVLQNLLIQIENVKQLKTQTNDTYV